MFGTPSVMANLWRFEMENEENVILEGFQFDPATGLYMVYVNGDLRGAAPNQVEASIIYEAVRNSC